MIQRIVVLAFLAAATTSAFVVRDVSTRQTLTQLHESTQQDTTSNSQDASSRRTFLATSAVAAAATFLPPPPKAEAIGPVRIDLLNPRYYAKPCPKVSCADR
jgi:hypothetical protein